MQRPVPRCEVAPRTMCTTLAEEVPVTSCRDATLTLCEEVSPQEQLCRQQCRTVPVQRQVTVPQVGLLVISNIQNWTTKTSSKFQEVCVETPSQKCEPVAVQIPNIITKNTC